MPWLMDSVEAHLNRMIVSRHMIDAVIRDVVHSRTANQSKLDTAQPLTTAPTNEPKLIKQPVRETTIASVNDEQASSMRSPAIYVV